MGKTLLALCRVSNLPTVWMNVLTAALLTEGAPVWSQVLFLMIALSASYCGGMVLNDYFDREYDALEQSFRPIPAGRISAEAALLVATSLLAFGFGAVALAPYRSALWPAAVLLLVIYAYDRWHKAHDSSVLLMAAARTLVFVVTAWGLSGSVSALVVLAGLVSFGWTLAVTVVARRENERRVRFAFPVIPWMIAGMALVDGVVLAIFVSPGWLLVGATAMGMTRLAQQYVRGD